MLSTIDCAARQLLCIVAGTESHAPINQLGGGLGWGACFYVVVSP